MIAQMGVENLRVLTTPTGSSFRSAAQNLDQFLQFQPHLMDELLALVQIHLRIVAGEPVPGSANGKTLFIQEAANLTNDEHILPLVITPIAATLDRLQLREFLLPIAQHVGFHAAEVADFADGEVALPRDRRQLAIVAWFQHTPRREPSIFGQDGM